jgi:hypothetical protein
LGPRFAVADLAGLNEQRLAALEADALKKLGGARQAYLKSVTIGAHPFVRQAGAHAIEVRVRDVPEDSVRANYFGLFMISAAVPWIHRSSDWHARDSARDWTCDHQLFRAIRLGGHRRRKE